MKILNKLWWILPLIVFIFFLGSAFSLYEINYSVVIQLCNERGYTGPVNFERWKFNGTEIFSIYCTNNDKQQAIVESFDIYNDLFQERQSR